MLPMEAMQFEREHLCLRGRGKVAVGETRTRTGG